MHHTSCLHLLVFIALLLEISDSLRHKGLVPLNDIGDAQMMKHRKLTQNVQKKGVQLKLGINFSMITSS